MESKAVSSSLAAARQDRAPRQTASEDAAARIPSLDGADPKDAEPEDQSTTADVSAPSKGVPTRLPFRDRRKGPRREPNPERVADFAWEQSAARDLLPRNWNYLIGAMVASVMVGVLLSGDVPGTGTSAMLGAAIAALVAGNVLNNRRAVRESFDRARSVALAAAVPIFLFGFGMTLWSLDHGLPRDAALAAMLCIGGITSTLMRRDPAAIIVSQLGLWSAAVLARGSVAGFAALAVALAVALVVLRDEAARHREEHRQRRARERAQARSREILSEYEETRQGWFWETDRRSLLTYVSAPVAQALGTEPEHLIGQPLVCLFSEQGQQDENDRRLEFHLSMRTAFDELPLRAAMESEERWWAISGRPIFDANDNFLGFRGSGTDLTERLKSQERASRLARFDSLTDLSNRFQMSQRLEEILTAVQPKKRACAVLLLDLDRFKQVNDMMGHPAGDELLRQVARRLEDVVGQAGLVGRLGGDEFEIIIPRPARTDDLEALSAAIIEAISRPYRISGQDIIIGVSIGIARAPQDGVTSETLIRNADLALYAAKDAGRGRYHFFSEDLHAAAQARAKLEADLREAIAKGDLQLFYQPVVELAKQRITAFEALLRWEHPERGWVPPQRFVEAAEYTGLIAVMGEWAIRTACQQLAKWPDDVRVSVNVSPIQFSNPELPAIVAGAIAEARIDPARLELEITESVYLNDDEGTDAMFARLKAIGVRLALDDFGTGYSALGYLKKAPFDRIKIDQSFVRGASDRNSRNRAIIASINSLAQALGMDTTAEGVETREELDLVRSLGCSHVQGFYFARAMDGETATARLAQGVEAPPAAQKNERAPREDTVRRVVLEHAGHSYTATLRNLSKSGAMIEGLRAIPVGAQFVVHLSQSEQVEGTVRWSAGDRMGLSFAKELRCDENGAFPALKEPAATPSRPFAGRRAR